MNNFFTQKKIILSLLVFGVFLLTLVSLTVKKSNPTPAVRVSFFLTDQQNTPLAQALPLGKDIYLTVNHALSESSAPWKLRQTPVEIIARDDALDLALIRANDFEAALPQWFLGTLKAEEPLWWYHPANTQKRSGTFASYQGTPDSPDYRAVIIPEQSISRGDSGLPVWNQSGELVGIISAAKKAPDRGYLIPSVTLQQFVDQY